MAENEPVDNALNVNLVGVSDALPAVSWALIGALVAGLLLVLIKWLAPVLSPILLAAYITALCLPLYTWLQAKGLSRIIALVAMLLIVVLGFGGIVLLALSSANSLREGLAVYTDGLARSAAALEPGLAALPGLAAAQNYLAGDALSLQLSRLLGVLAGALGNMLFSLVLVAFFLLEAERFFGLAEKQLRDRPLFSELPEVASTAVTYFGIRTRLNLLTGLGFGLALFLLGVDYALLWGLLAFLLSYIPYIGLTLATIPPVLLALAEFGPGRALLVILLAAAINLSIENILEPAYTGKRLSLSPTVVVISFFVWAWLLGPVGALLSMPITVLLMLVFAKNARTRWVAQIISNEPAGPPPDPAPGV